VINSINSSAAMMPQPGGENVLSQEQQALILETLSQFDTENLSQDDAIKIVEAFAQAGIQPGTALEEAMAEHGFDAKQIGELAQASQEGNRPPPPPPQQSSEDVSSMGEYLTNLVEQTLAENNSTELTDEDKQSILSKLFEKYDVAEGSSAINTSV